MKKVLITQSNYIPWKGYFDAINQADEVILLDNVQFTKRDWRNRNIIKTQNGTLWLTIPVEVKGKYFQNINDTRISDARWNEKHWETIRHNYSKAANFNELKDFVQWLYAHATMEYLSDINHWFLTEISKWMKILTPMSSSSIFEIEQEDPTRRLLEICKKTNSTIYLTGPAAKAYLNESLFQQTNIQIHYLDYQNYPEHPQLFPPFDHAVSILDLLFNTGNDFRRYMKSYSHEHK